MELTFFPTPYPDETIYSVLCRFHLRLGRPSYYYTCEKLIGRNLSLNTYVPHGIGLLASRLPEYTKLTGEYLIHKTTMFPYFAPFLSEERKCAFSEYMLDKSNDSADYSITNLKVGSLRYPKHLYLRFCKSCLKEEIQMYGEPYWHRVHQLPGVMMCPHHKKPLMDSPILVSHSNYDFYAASVSMIERSSICGHFKGDVADKLILLSQNSQWLLENGHERNTYEQTFPRYDLWLRNKGLSSLNGRVWHNKIFSVVNSFFGEEFLKMVDAYDEDQTNTWSKRILFGSSKLQHPMYHILLHILLAGSTATFLDSDCQAPKPYGESPWPCRNPICPYNLKDVIDEIDMKYDRGLYRASFECPHCGFIYKRKHPIPKKEQYAGNIYVASYGRLWFQKLRECIVEQGLSPRRTCEYLKCDMYTVQKYAVQLGYMKPEDTTEHLNVRNKRTEPMQNKKPVLSENDERDRLRQMWIQLITDNPNANRSLLKTLASTDYNRLVKSDRAWLEEHLPPSTQSSYVDWMSRDTEYLEKVQETVGELRDSTGKPIWISLHRITLQTGIHQIRNKKSLAKMPKTAAFLSENVESIDDWRKRKIIWAIRILRENDKTVTPFKIAAVATINSDVITTFYDFIHDCLRQEETIEKI